MTDAVITGLGAVSPVGLGASETWKAMLNGRSGIDRIRRFDSSTYAVTLAGEISNFDDESAVGSRMMPQTDRSTRLSFAAAKECLADAVLDPSEWESYEAGVATANFAGGFDFGQRELHELWSNGSSYVSAYQSFAWFYAVNTGQLSIRHGMRGAGGAVVADECGGLEALALARRNIRSGTPIQLTGAVDFSLCSWGVASLQTSGRYTERTDPATAYLPFDSRATGAVPGEGGAMMVLEDAGHAHTRGADAYARFAGHAASFDPVPGSHTGLVRCVRTALADAGISAGDVDVVFADGAGAVDADREEVCALVELFGPRAIPVTVPKSTVGRLLSGGSALDVCVAVQAVRYGLVPPTVHSRPDADLPIDLVVDTPREVDVRHALVIARGHGGLCSAVVLSRL
nr:beta-ketoacyl synthase N-terminal-like domain-containing protein [Rhodococcus sp. (in: high G+C Gram-positive bacteria)]